jgi:hypothetical protein
MTTGPRLQVEVAQTDDSTKNVQVIFDKESGSLAIDYSSYYERMATSLETITTKLTEIEDHQKEMLDLAKGDGINMKGPYEWLSMYAIYRLLIEQGITDFNSLKSQIDSLPKNF